MSKEYQNFKYHWENNGKWSCYVFGDEFRFTHKRNDGLIGYGRYPFDEAAEVDKLPVEMEYVKKNDINKCIRCGKHVNEFREEFNNACLCERCYQGLNGGNEHYEISECGFKGKKVS